MHFNNTLGIKAERLFKKTMELAPYTFFILILFSFDEAYLAVMTLISAVIHELGHIAALQSIGIKGGFFATLAGPRLYSLKNLSYKQEIIVAASGPLANLAIFFSVFLFRASGYLSLFGIVNLLTALSNLLPIKSYDGYRIIECIIAKSGYYDSLEVVISAISFILTSLLTFLSLYSMSRFNSGYWIFFIFIFFLIKTISADRRVFFKRKREKKRAFKRI